MKEILGFGKAEEATNAREEPRRRQSGGNGVKSLVQVSFPDVSRAYAYYNDGFDLREGDLVYVSGRLAGKLGYVEWVNRRFKINLADYERVLAHPIVEFHGTYRRIMDKMVSYDAEALGPDQVRSWVKPPVSEDEDAPEYVQGEGYSLELERFIESDEVEGSVLERAVDYCRSGRVKYLTLRNGIGTAFVEGSQWYEVNFTYRDGLVSDLYCECPYSRLCKHNLAVLLTLKELLKRTDGENFTAVDRNYFLRMLSVSGQEIKL